MNKLQFMTEDQNMLLRKFTKIQGRPANQSEFDAIFVNLLRHKFGLDPIRYKPIVASRSREKRNKDEQGN